VSAVIIAVNGNCLLGGCIYSLGCLVGVIPMCSGMLIKINDIIHVTLLFIIST